MSVSDARSQWPDNPTGPAKRTEEEEDESGSETHRSQSGTTSGWVTIDPAQEASMEFQYKFRPETIEAILQRSLTTSLEGTGVNEEGEVQSQPDEEMIASVARDAVIAPIFSAISVSALGLAVVMSIFSLIVGAYWLIPIFLAGVLFFGYAYLVGYE